MKEKDWEINHKKIYLQNKTNHLPHKQTIFSSFPNKIEIEKDKKEIELINTRK